MRWILLAVVLLTRPGAAMTDSVWTNLPPVYTNILGRELCNGIWLRDRWSGGTNWWFTNTVSVTYGFSNDVSTRVFTNGDTVFSRNLTNQVALTTNIIVTNVFGDSFVADLGGVSVTGSVLFEASGAERLTDHFDTLLPRFVLPYWSRSPDWSFDTWFTNLVDGLPIDRWPGIYHKAELMHKYPACGIAVSEGESGTNCSTNVWTTDTAEVTPDVIAGEIVTPAGYWLKRRNRINPLLVAEWKAGEAKVPAEQIYPDSGFEFWQGAFVRTNACEYYRGWTNEFVSGASRLFGLSSTQFPVFVVHPGGSNDYVGGLSLVFSGTNGYPHDVIIAEWTNQSLKVTNSWSSGSIPLLSATQRCNRAWLALGAPLHLEGIPPNFTINTNDIRYFINTEGNTPPLDIIEVPLQGFMTLTNWGYQGFVTTNTVTNSSCTVSLQYTNRMNSYEGDLAWDSILLPEQLTANYVALTNHFLVPWTNWTWTNSILYSGRTNISAGFPVTNVAFEITGNATGTVGQVVNGWYTPLSDPYLGKYSKYLEGDGEVVHRIWTWGAGFMLFEYIPGAIAQWYATNEWGPYTPYNPDASGTAYVTRITIPGQFDGDGTPIPVGYLPYPTNYIDSRTIAATAWLQEPTYLWWWIATNGFPFFDPWVLSNGVGIATNNMAPVDYLSATASGGVVEDYTAMAHSLNPADFDDPDTVWNWQTTATRVESNIVISVASSGIVSSVMVTGLYTGTPHRVHLYTLTADTNAYLLGPSQYYHRLGIFPEAFTNLDTIITVPVDPRRTDGYLIAWTNDVAAHGANQTNYAFCTQVLYTTSTTVDGIDVLDTNYTHAASNIIYSRSTLVDYPAIYTNYMGTNYYGPHRTNSVITTTNESFRCTVAGWTPLIPSNTGTTIIYRPQEPPPSYSWLGFAVTNEPLISSNTPDVYLYARFVLDRVGGLDYDDGTEGANRYTNAATGQILYLDGGTWYLVDAGLNGLYSTTDYFASTTATWTDIGGGGTLPEFYRSADWITFPQDTPVTNKYEILPSGWGFEADRNPAWGIYMWRDSSYYLTVGDWPYAYLAYADSEPWLNIVAPSPKPIDLDLPTSLMTTIHAHETLHRQTNWSNSVGIKVLIEWQR